MNKTVKKAAGASEILPVDSGLEVDHLAVAHKLQGILEVDPKSKIFNVLGNLLADDPIYTGAEANSEDAGDVSPEVLFVYDVLAAMDYLAEKHDIRLDVDHLADMDDWSLMKLNSDFNIDAANADDNDDEYTSYDILFAQDLFLMMAGSPAKLIAQREKLRGLSKEADDPETKRFLESQVNVFEAIRKNPRPIRKRLRQHLSYIDSDDTRSYVDSILMEGADGKQQLDADEKSTIVDILNTKTSRMVDFEVLPDGELQAYAAEIVERLREHDDTAHIDLQRVLVLNKFRDLVGRNNTYFAKGTRRKDSDVMYSEELEQEVFGDYIVLVIRQIDGSENALAISPVAKKHAGYLVRSDVSRQGWEDLLSLTKQDARVHGARALRFDPSEGCDTYAEYLKKLEVLFACPLDKFGHHLGKNRKGEYYMRETRATMRFAHNAGRAAVSESIRL